MPKKVAVRRSQRERTDATVEALIAAALGEFGDSGFVATSLDDISVAAGVTKGALYHHFPGGKPEVFEAAALNVLERMVESLESAVRSTREGADRLRDSIDAYFEVALEERVQRILLQDAPSVFGIQRWRETEYRYTWKFIRDGLASMNGNAARTEASKDMCATIIFGACCEATLTIATSDKPKAARALAVGMIVSLCNALLET